MGRNQTDGVRVPCFYTPVTPLGFVFLFLLFFYTDAAPLGLWFVWWMHFYTHAAPLGLGFYMTRGSTQIPHLRC